MQTRDIRQHFLEYFQRHDHEIVPSSSLIPHHDPSLLFINAGMVPFKNVFTGVETRPYQRATSAQKCVRAGGKHNDLANVGYTARHHTFFEMLGNFSFGDYFKERAIEMAWHLITKEWSIPSNRLLVTVYAEDEEAAQLWRKIADLPDSRILRIATQDNFWSMGETGPCGPCSEIFYDHGDHIPGGPPGSPDEDGDRFVEIWNLVFMQYEQQESGRVALPRPSIDTGMGLERIAAVLQGVHDNYDIDLFQALTAAARDITHTHDDPKMRQSHRVMADHIRSICFLLADGVTISNEGRGYVLRRIMRRAMRHAHKLGCNEAVLWQMVPTLINEMGQAYPELKRGQTMITEAIRLEEERFLETLDRGLKVLQQEVNHLNAGEDVPGPTLFKLHDTYGFPIDLTADILREQNIKIDLSGFEEAMARQKALARANWNGSGDAAEGKVWHDIYQRVGGTEFLGYAASKASGFVCALVKDGKEQEQLEGSNQLIEIVTSQTPFYAESGGQMGDQGIMKTDDGVEVDIIDTIKQAGALHVHRGYIRKGTLTVGKMVEMHINQERRQLLRMNHSATHLLHTALHHCLGPQVVQKGSLVAPDRLRFDFSFNRALTIQEIGCIESKVNQAIWHDYKVDTQELSFEEAQKRNAVALFGEKYGDVVRVVAMQDEENSAMHPFSIELCGGTHVKRSGQIGAFKIIAQSSVGTGVRRIEAITGPAVVTQLRQAMDQQEQMAQLLRTNPEHVIDKVQRLLEEQKSLRQQLKQAQMQRAAPASQESETFNGVTFYHKALQGVPAKQLRGLVDKTREDIKKGVVLITTTDKDKVSFVVGVTDDLTDHYNAVTLAQEGAKLLGGAGGGGRPDMAQGGGVIKSNIPHFVDYIRTVLGKG